MRVEYSYIIDLQVHDRGKGCRGSCANDDEDKSGRLASSYFWPCRLSVSSSKASEEQIETKWMKLALSVYPL